MTALEQELQEENERLQEENERLYQQVGQLQAQLTTMTAKEQAVKPLIEEIKRQEQEIMSLNSSLIEERRQNEMLLKLSENERALKSENKKLKDEKSRIEAELAQKKKVLEGLTDKYNNIADMLPNDEEVKTLFSRFKSLFDTVDDVQARVTNFEWNWKERIIFSLLIVVFFAIGQVAIQKYFVPDADYAKRIMWNIEYGEPRVTFFENEKDAEQKYENQHRYEMLEDLKRQQAK